mmetsp:Transcript_78345/g.196688  ORF Transcript_78345/g.196688 Transcript_78345/m.196688 type:complete len:266 (-) Transcript_78345:795-1592(-)
MALRFFARTCKKSSWFAFRSAVDSSMASSIRLIPSARLETSAFKVVKVSFWSAITFDMLLISSRASLRESSVSSLSFMHERFFFSSALSSFFNTPIMPSIILISLPKFACLPRSASTSKFSSTGADFPEAFAALSNRMASNLAFLEPPCARLLTCKNDAGDEETFLDAKRSVVSSFPKILMVSESVTNSSPRIRLCSAYVASKVPHVVFICCTNIWSRLRDSDVDSTSSAMSTIFALISAALSDFVLIADAKALASFVLEDWIIS